MMPVQALELETVEGIKPAFWWIDISSDGSWMFLPDATEQFLTLGHFITLAVRKSIEVSPSDLSNYQVREIGRSPFFRNNAIPSYILASDGSPSEVWDDQLPDLGIPALSWELPRSVFPDAGMSSEVICPSNPFKEPNSGWIYLLRCLIQNRDNGKLEYLYKLGMSADPITRISKLEVKLPYDVTPEHIIVCRNRIQAEAKWAHYWRSQRVRGEFYRLDEFDVSCFKTIKVIDPKRKVD